MDAGLKHGEGSRAAACINTELEVAGMLQGAPQQQQPQYTPAEEYGRAASALLAAKTGMGRAFSADEWRRASGREFEAVCAKRQAGVLAGSLPPPKRHNHSSVLAASNVTCEPVVACLCSQQQQQQQQQQGTASMEHQPSRSTTVVAAETVQHAALPEAAETEMGQLLLLSPALAAEEEEKMAQQTSSSSRHGVGEALLGKQLPVAHFKQLGMSQCCNDAAAAAQHALETMPPPEPAIAAPAEGPAANACLPLAENNGPHCSTPAAITIGGGGAPGACASAPGACASAPGASASAPGASVSAADSAAAVGSASAGSGSCLNSVAVLEALASAKNAGPDSSQVASTVLSTLLHASSALGPSMTLTQLALHLLIRLHVGDNLLEAVTDILASRLQPPLPPLPPMRPLQEEHQQQPVVHVGTATAAPLPPQGDVLLECQERLQDLLLASSVAAIPAAMQQQQQYCQQHEQQQQHGPALMAAALGAAWSEGGDGPLPPAGTQQNSADAAEGLLGQERAAPVELVFEEGVLHADVSPAGDDCVAPFTEVQPWAGAYPAEAEAAAAVSAAAAKTTASTAAPSAPASGEHHPAAQEPAAAAAAAASRGQGAGIQSGVSATSPACKAREAPAQVPAPGGGAAATQQGLATSIFAIQPSASVLPPSSDDNNDSHGGQIASPLRGPRHGTVGRQARQEANGEAGRRQQGSSSAKSASPLRCTQPARQAGRPAGGELKIHGRRVRAPLTEREVALLLDLVGQHGTSWVTVQAEGRKLGMFLDQSRQQLKDKWRVTKTPELEAKARNVNKANARIEAEAKGVAIRTAAAVTTAAKHRAAAAAVVSVAAATKRRAAAAAAASSPPLASAAPLVKPKSSQVATATAKRSSGRSPRPKHKGRPLQKQGGGTKRATPVLVGGTTKRKVQPQPPKRRGRPPAVVGGDAKRKVQQQPPKRRGRPPAVVGSDAKRKVQQQPPKRRGRPPAGMLRPRQPTPKLVLLGCPKCRFAPKGCGQCRLRIARASQQTVAGMHHRAKAAMGKKRKAAPPPAYHSNSNGGENGGGRAGKRHQATPPARIVLPLPQVRPRPAQLPAEAPPTALSCRVTDDDWSAYVALLQYLRCSTAAEAYAVLDEVAAQGHCAADINPRHAKRCSSCNVDLALRAWAEADDANKLRGRMFCCECRRQPRQALLQQQQQSLQQAQQQVKGKDDGKGQGGVDARHRPQQQQQVVGVGGGGVEGGLQGGSASFKEPRAAIQQQQQQQQGGLKEQQQGAAQQQGLPQQGGKKARSAGGGSGEGLKLGKGANKVAKEGEQQGREGGSPKQGMGEEEEEEEGGAAPQVLVRLAGDAVLRGVRDFLRHASGSSHEREPLPPAHRTPFEPPQRPCVRQERYSIRGQLALPVMSILNGIQHPQRRAELKLNYSAGHVAMFNVDELVKRHPLRDWAEGQLHMQRSPLYRAASELGVNSREGRSLVLVAHADERVASGAVMHVDPSEADNTGFLTQDEPQPAEELEGRLVAVWTFINPHYIGSVNAHLRHLRGLSVKRQGMDSPGGVRLDPDQAAELLAVFGPEVVQVVHQLAGQRVYVPPGWVHCVYNMLPCVKIAWDSLEPPNLVRYVDTHQQVAARYTRHHNPPDYIAVGELLLRYACDWVAQQQQQEEGQQLRQEGQPAELQEMGEEEGQQQQKEGQQQQKEGQLSEPQEEEEEGQQHQQRQQQQKEGQLAEPQEQEEEEEGQQQQNEEGQQQQQQQKVEGQPSEPQEEEEKGRQQQQKEGQPSEPQVEGRQQQKEEGQQQQQQKVEGQPSEPQEEEEEGRQEQKEDGQQQQQQQQKEGQPSEAQEEEEEGRQHQKEEGQQQQQEKGQPAEPQEEEEEGRQQQKEEGQPAEPQEEEESEEQGQQQQKEKVQQLRQEGNSAESQQEEEGQQQQQEEEEGRQQKKVEGQQQQKEGQPAELEEKEEGQQQQQEKGHQPRQEGQLAEPQEEEEGQQQQREEGQQRAVQQQQQQPAVQQEKEPPTQPQQEEEEGLQLMQLQAEEGKEHLQVDGQNEVQQQPVQQQDMQQQQALHDARPHSQQQQRAEVGVIAQQHGLLEQQPAVGAVALVQEDAAAAKLAAVVPEQASQQQQLQPLAAVVGNELA